MIAYENVPICKPREAPVTCVCGGRARWVGLRMVCSRCHYGTYDLVSDNHFNIRVRYSDVRQLTNPDRTWWHGTAKADWGNAVPDNVYVHVGSKGSARFIAPAERGYFYRVRLKPHAVFDPHIYIDENDWPMWDVDYDALSRGVAARYVNKVEVPGSISVLVLHGDLEVLYCEDVNGRRVRF